MIHFINFFFFFNDPATTEIYTLSLHDALPIYRGQGRRRLQHAWFGRQCPCRHPHAQRSEEHTSELQSHVNLVCRLLLEKKKKINQKMMKVYNNKPYSAGLNYDYIFDSY